VSSNHTDISLIRQYLNGELDARAMHELERRAQQDPFLADALDGYEHTGVNPGKQTIPLQQLLQKRIVANGRKLVLWPGVSIAASVLLAGAVGFWIYFSQQPASPKVAAVVPTAAVSAAPGTPAVSSPSLPPDKNSLVALEPSMINREKPSVNSKPPVVADNEIVRIDEPVGNAPVTASVTEADTVAKAPEGYFAPQRTIVLSGKNKVPTMKADSQYRMASQQLNGKVEGVQVDIEPGDRRLISGKLIDGTDGQPLMNAMVRVKGAPNGAMTDKAGNFRIAAGEKDVLQLSSIGYQSKEIKAARQGDSLNIKLQPSQLSLSEVVITTAPKPGKNAEPMMGWKSYQRVINNMSAPDGKTGTVKLEFTASANGKLSNFKVISSLSDAANQTAINRISNGPPWHGNRNGKPEQVRVKVKFVKD
jgi:hypothetical protein